MILNLGIMRTRNLILILFITLSSLSCVDKYWPEIDKYESVLVVDGLLTNGNDTTVVYLSLSSSVNNGELIPLGGSQLYIVDENQSEVFLTETSTGIYKILDNSFTGRVGGEYQLHITLPNGKKYTSDICRMQNPSPLDSVYGLMESHQIPNSDEFLDGVQFYLDNHSNLSDTTYYLWRLEQSFQYQSTFNIDFIWNGSIFDPYPKPDSLRTCWYTSPAQSIFTHSTKYTDKPELIGMPLNYVSTINKTLSIRYSLLVNQLSISEEAFNFWDALRQQNIEKGNLYSQQPFQIRGNIKNVNNAEEPVLGYFTVAGISKKRIYINRPPLVFHYDECVPDYEGMRFIRFEPGPIYIVNVEGTLALGNSDICFDCRLEGGSITPPYFWQN